MSIESLKQRQNPDGGWPYRRGASWTEPSAYAVLALLAAGENGAAARGAAWLRAEQRSDGGFPPQPGVQISGWTTALAALLPPDLLGRESHARAIEWLLQSSGKESTWSYRVRAWLLGGSTDSDSGWAWAPNAAAWVGPTALAVVSLQKEAERRTSPRLRERIALGQRFLMDRMCSGGGWNYGNSRVLDEDLRPYPETTGMALAALRGETSPRLAQAVGVAAKFLAECRSADAWNWLRLGLHGHAGLPAECLRTARFESRTTPEAALDLLAANPQSFFGDSHAA
ncbi:MAG TPA: hypothetical protein VMU19_10385 [Bryobacteraceae bacterium]|nr:hypothetical protein [Bryobacteraceae bacterium]